MFDIKKSNLHYLVKETHLSAFITIRKKFIKPSNDDTMTAKDVTRVNRNSEKNENAEHEIFNMKQRNKDLGCDLAQLTFHFEELEVKNETLNNINIGLEDKLEEQKSENLKLVNKIYELKKNSVKQTKGSHQN